MAINLHLPAHIGSRLAVLGRALVFVASGVCLLTSTPLRSAVIIWDGGAGTGAWATGTNWSINAVPATTDSLVFDASSANSQFAITLGANRTTAGITFNAAAGTNAFTFSGNTLTINAGGITNNDADTQTFNSAVTANSAQIWNAASGGLVFNTVALSNTLTLSGIANISVAGTLTNSGGNRTITNNSTGAVTFNNISLSNDGTARTLTLSGTGNTVVSGVIANGGTAASGNLTKSGTGTLTLSGANTYAGATTVSAGVLNIQNNSALGTTGGATTVASGAALQMQGGITVTGEALTLNGTGISNDGALRNVSGNNTWAGPITLGSASRINSDAGTLAISGNIGGAAQNLTVGGAGNTAVSGAIGTTTGSLTKDGAGLLTLSGTNTYSGATNINAGTLSLGASNALSNSTAVTVASGAALNLNNFSDAIGSIAGAGNVTLGSGALTAGANNTSTTFSGNISGSGALTKSGSGTLTLSGANTYTGATNVNAGVLSVQNSGALGTSANTANTTVASGATLQLANGITTTNGGTLVLNGAGAGSGALQSVSGNNTWDSAISLASNATILSSIAGNTLFLNANYVSAHTLTMGNHTLTIDGPGDIWANANVGVSGDTGGLVKNGTGKLTLYGYNTFYTGDTIVNAGSLDLIVGPFIAGWYGINGALTIGTGPANPALAGTVSVNIATNSYANQISPTSAVTINSDGVLNVGASTGLGTLILNGGRVNLTSGQTVTAGGDITSNTNSAHQTSLISGGVLNLATGNINVARDATLAGDLTISSAIGGTSGLSKNGAGTLVISGANTYSGATTVNAGTLALGANENMAGALVLAGGRLNLGGFTSTFNSLSVTASSIIDFGTGGTSILNILNTVSIASTATLTIENWTDTVDYFYSLVNPGATNLGQIVFNGFAAANTKWQSYDHQITPVPETSMYGAALLGLSALFAAWRIHRRWTS